MNEFCLAIMLTPFPIFVAFVIMCIGQVFDRILVGWCGGIAMLVGMVFLITYYTIMPDPYLLESYNRECKVRAEGYERGYNDFKFAMEKLVEETDGL